MTTDREFDAASTLLDVPDVQNFRDAGVGGLRTGLLYRSGSLSRLTPDGAQRLKALGVRTVVDLRTAAELAVWPDERHGLTYRLHHLPLVPDGDGSKPTWPATQAEAYPFMAEVGGPAVAGTVRRLAEPDAFPAVIHCAVGKDRTGLTIAVIQSLAGLSEAEIMADYLRSNRNLGLDNGPIPYTDEHGRQQFAHPVRPDHLLAALARLHDLHGSIPAYLHAHGVTEADLDALRGALVS
ncbi:tyrosine-protein phosphatase [Kitasatospora sp. NPDC101801]|uniref:tyrosine-protein phosphatase n=1 Tax=Kitasatospora sp. NPDC101801 TaxID=3364103 RepID=UPI0037FC1905